MNKLYLFLFFSLLILWVSRKPLMNLKSHGFFRTFGWISTLWLLINNLPFWFYNLLSWNQLISYILLLYAIVLVVFGGIFLIKLGKQDRERKENHLFAFEKTSQLVETGIYRYLRHPLYASLFFLSWGIFFKNISYTTFVITLVASVFYVLTMITEEKENIAYWGGSYAAYMKRTKMLIPFII